MPVTHTPQKQKAEAKATHEARTEVNNMIEYTVDFGTRKEVIQISQKEKEYLYDEAQSMESKREFLKGICRRLGIWQDNTPQEADASASKPVIETTPKKQEPTEDEEFEDIERRSKKLERNIPSPTPTDKSIEEIKERSRTMQESLKQNTEIKKPNPDEEQEERNKACKDRQHEFQHRTKTYLAAPARKFKRAVTTLKYHLDIERYPDDISRQEGNALLNDVADLFREVEKARLYCEDALDEEEALQLGNAYLHNKEQEFEECVRIHKEYFEQQEENKIRRQTMSQQQPPFYGDIHYNIPITTATSTRPTNVSSTSRPDLAQNMPVIMSTPFPQHARPPFKPIIDQDQNYNQSHQRAGPNYHDQQGPYYSQSQQRPGNYHDQQGPYYSQSQQRPGNYQDQQGPYYSQSQQRPGNYQGQQDPYYGQTHQRSGHNYHGPQDSHYGQPQNNPQTGFRVFEDQNHGSRMPSQPVYDTHHLHHTRFKLNVELSLVEKFDASQPRTYMAFRAQWTNFMAKMEKEQRSNLDIYYSLLKVLGGTAYDLVNTKYPNEDSYAIGIQKLDDLFYNPTNLLRDMVQNLLKGNKMNDSPESLLGGYNKLKDAWNDLNQADLTKEQLKGLLFIAATEKNLSEESWKCWLDIQNQVQYKENPAAAFAVKTYLGAIETAMVNAQRRKNALGSREYNTRIPPKTGKKHSTLFGSYSNTPQDNNQSQVKIQKQARGPKNTCITCGANPHKYQLHCPKLKDMTANQIYAIMTNFGIECQMCLGLGHRTKDCLDFKEGRLQPCKVKENGQECKRYHCRALHKFQKPKEESKGVPPTQSKQQ